MNHIGRPQPTSNPPNEITNPQFNPVFVSRYFIDNDSLRRAALALQVGQGVADRIRSMQATEFISKAESWVERQISDYIYVPLSPIRAPGQSQTAFAAALNANPSQITRLNFPVDFIEACIYRALNLLLNSEFFENQANVSQAGKWAQAQAETLVASFKDQTTFQVGAGRRRNPNPFVPPNIAPRMQPQPKQDQT